MRERGLGTPATRAAIIETLLSRGYVVREGKALRSTPQGAALVDRVDAHFARAVEVLRDCRGRVIVTGMGKSGIIARKIAANPPIAMRYMKEGLRLARHATMSEMGAFVGNSLAYLFTTEDHREGAMSFVERRAPVFKGR